MNELCFFTAVLELNKFLTIDFNKQIWHKEGSFPLRISRINVTKTAVDLVTFTEEILNGKLHFFCSEK